MTSKLIPILETAREILRTAGLKGMHVDDVAAEAAKFNKNLSLTQDEFSKKLQAALAANLNHANRVGTNSKGRPNTARRGIRCLEGSVFGVVGQGYQPRS